jgi:hypothetical protein
MLLVSFVSYGQKEVSDTVDYKRNKQDDYLKDYKTNHLFKAIKMDDGTYINVGDEIIIGKPVTNNTRKEANSGLFSGNVVTTSTFNFLLIGRLGMSIMGGMQYLPATFTNRKVKVKEIKKGWIIYEFNDGGSVGTILNVVDAFNSGEMINPNAAMTRDQAIVKLKEQKDLLDLGMITKEQFDKIKLELTPIIMK